MKNKVVFGALVVVSLFLLCQCNVLLLEGGDVAAASSVPTNEPFIQTEEANFTNDPLDINAEIAKIDDGSHVKFTNNPGEDPVMTLNGFNTKLDNAGANGITLPKNTHLVLIGDNYYASDNAYYLFVYDHESTDDSCFHIEGKGTLNLNCVNTDPFINNYYTHPISISECKMNITMDGSWYAVSYFDEITIDNGADVTISATNMYKSVIHVDDCSYESGVREFKNLSVDNAHLYITSDDTNIFSNNKNVIDHHSLNVKRIKADTETGVTNPSLDFVFDASVMSTYKTVEFGEKNPATGADVKYIAIIGFIIAMTVVLIAVNRYEYE